MAWHGYFRASFSGVLVGGEGVSKGDQGKVEKSMEGLITNEAKAKIVPRLALQPRWSIDKKESIFEAEFTNEPDKTAMLLALVGEFGVLLPAVLDLQVFGAGKNDWEASRVACLDYIVSHEANWNIPVGGK